jgi:hypothetical protein
MIEYATKLGSSLSRYLTFGNPDTTGRYDLTMICGLMLVLLALHGYGPAKNYIEKRRCA